MTDVNSITTQSEKFDEEKKYKESFELLEKANKENPNEFEITWRLARAYFNISEQRPDDKEYKKQMSLKGLEFAQEALKQNPDHWAGHKWVAIMLSSVSEVLPTKEKIENAFKIKEHALKALEIRPDATTTHLLGRWCYNVSSIGWIERKVAATLFASPPESSYDEALQYFLKAAELEKNFPRNDLCAGDTYLQLGKKDKAKEFYQKAVAAPVISEADKALNQEAKTKLAKV